MNYRYDLKKKSILLVGYVPNFEFRHNCFKLHNNLFEKYLFVHKHGLTCLYILDSSVNLINCIYKVTLDIHVKT